MRRALSILAVLGMTAGCGGGGTEPINPNPPPPPPASIPATVSVQSGDNQEAEPDSAVALRPAVVVRSASGLPVPGVAVTFRVDSGGGTLSSSSAVSGATGVAAAGDWILGPAEGTNVVVATVGSLSPAKFRAQARFGLTRTLIAPKSVGPGGTTLRYARPGDPLSGLELVIPPGAYATSSTWSLIADSSIRVPLPADFSQVGPALTISNGQGYGDSLMALTVPMRIGAEFAVAPFFFDPATGTLEGIPLLARTDSSITLATRHFSGEHLAIPQATLRAAVRSSVLAFGTIRMVFVKIPTSKLMGTHASTFLPGQDDWEFPNHGDYQGPNGNCEGMTATAIYYHYFFRSAGRPPLFHQFDRHLSNEWDNVDGIHLVGAVQADYSALLTTTKAQQDVIRDRAATTGQTVESLASTWILLNLKLTRRPLLLGLYNPAGGHAVVAYQASASPGEVRVSFADPNLPGVVRSLTYQNGTLVPVALRTIASGPTSNFITSTVFGVTSDIPLSKLHARWAEFANKTPGLDRLPDPWTFQVFDSVAQTWSALPDTVRLFADTLKLRVRCPGCPFRTTEEGADDLVNMTLFNDLGTTTLSTIWPVPTIPLVEGEHRYFAVAEARPPGGSFKNFLDGRYFLVLKGKLRLFPLNLVGKPDTAYTFVLTHGGLARPTSRYIWDFGDGSAVQTITGDSSNTHVFTALGTYNVKVELRDASGTILGQSASLVTIGEAARWRLVSFQQTSLTNTFPASHQPAAPTWEIARSSNELRDSILARPSGAILELFAAQTAHPQGFKRPDDQFLFRAETSTASPAMYLRFPRGAGSLAEAVAAVGSGTAPTLPAGNYPLSFINSYSRSESGVITYSGSAANWVQRMSTLIPPACSGPPGRVGGPPSSLAKAYIDFSATTTTSGLSGTITFVIQAAAIELQALPTVCWWEPMAVIRRTFSFTAVPEP